MKHMAKSDYPLAVIVTHKLIQNKKNSKQKHPDRKLGKEGKRAIHSAGHANDQ